MNALLFVKLTDNVSESIQLINVHSLSDNEKIFKMREPDPVFSLSVYCERYETLYREVA